MFGYLKTLFRRPKQKKQTELSPENTKEALRIISEEACKEVGVEFDNFRKNSDEYLEVRAIVSQRLLNGDLEKVGRKLRSSQTD